MSTLIIPPLAVLLMSGVLLAQPGGGIPQPPPPADPQAAAPAAAPASPGAAAPASSAGKWAPDPMGFVRGNRVPPQMGYYISLVKLIPIIALFLLWVQTSKWMDEDSRGLKVRPSFWSTLMLVCGVAGFLLALISPVYIVGFLAVLGFCGTPFGLYVSERNQRVPESSKVMTPKHIKSVITRQLSRLGINLGGAETVDSVAGPNIQFIGKTRTGGKDDRSSRQVERSRGYLAARELVYDSILRRATDIHLEPKDEELAARLRIDGVMYPTEPFDKVVGDAVVNIFKVLSAMDITERRRSQDGGFGAIVEGREVDFRVASQGTRHGEKMVIRILDQANSVSTLTQLGMRKQLQEKIEGVIHEPHGLFLCCGPTGAGKSTTLYACLNDIDSMQNNIITIEDPVEYKMSNVTQIEINTKADQTFAGSLRSVLRQDPDVVMVGEIRDGETARIACQAANTGHMVFSTVHANDTVTALYRLIDLEVDPSMLASSLTAILGQRLARRLCPQCREAYKPNPDFLKKAGLPPDRVEKLFRAPKQKTGCTNCGGLGYKGRIGVYELLVISERMRDMVRDKAAMSVIRSEARKEGMLYMKEEGLRLVARGVTSVDELLRVVK
ncbi:ATPase, T2SS/T4P/T4SS family [Maioricimonas rarisocia]|uniref:ATPase, T2SS/T4P/T4SS family n=1 Tax=Maioricimonas rarisocia TaxID=2528026 RepID=UPI001E48858D|nr:ATPase, T2SS/T4P/T4SS family [Maioricimonas rarisocia]